MRHFKGLRRFLVALVACGICLSAVSGSASALGFASIVAPTISLPATIEQEDTEQVADCLVSIVHYSAYTSSTVIGCLEDGTKVTVLSTRNHFYKIDCYDMVGYIHTSQVSKNEDGTYYVTSNGSTEAKYLPGVSQEQVLSCRDAVRRAALAMRGVRYVLGGYSRRGIDCSGLTRWSYTSAGYQLQRSATMQLSDGVIVSQDNLQCGDLIFFKNTTNAGTLATHVGIYLGNDQLIHAGSRGVTVAKLSASYFQEHYLCARRVILSAPSLQTILPNLTTSQDINSSYWRNSSQAQ